MPYSFLRQMDIRNIPFGLCFRYGLPRPEQYSFDLRTMCPGGAVRVLAKTSGCKSASRDLYAAGRDMDDDSAATACQGNVEQRGATAAARLGGGLVGILQKGTRRAH